MPIIALLAALGVTIVVLVVAVVVLPPLVAAAAIMWACGARTAPLVVPLAVAADISVWVWDAHLAQHQQDLPHTFQVIWFAGPIVLAITAYPIGRARRRRARTATTRRAARSVTPTVMATPIDASTRAPSSATRPSQMPSHAVEASTAFRVAHHATAARQWSIDKLAAQAASTSRQRPRQASRQPPSRWRSRP